MNELINIALSTINFYFKNRTIPTIEDLNLTTWNLLHTKWCIFVTIYKKWDVRWSAWNIKEFEPSVIHETIKSTIDAISKDSRFEPLKEEELNDIKLRIDYIKDRVLISEWKIVLLDPLKSWIIAISKDYSSAWIVLPNISNLLLSWVDFIWVLSAKMNKPFEEKNCYVYEIKTDVVTNY